MKLRYPALLLLAAAAAVSLGDSISQACTGITLRAQDGAVLFGRTLEWGPFDMHSQLLVIPRGHEFTAALDGGKPGKTWEAKYGVAGINGLGKDLILDGMNEHGLQVGLFYHPGVAEYPKFDAAKSAESIGPTDVGTYLLTTCETVDEVRAALAKIRVVPVLEDAMSIVPGVHYIATDPSGKAIVIEFLKGEMTVFEAPLGVVTNAPSYDWHLTNLRNYINLSADGTDDREFSGEDFRPIGAGSGMLGLPGDFTPPSRFVRAVEFTQTARPTKTADETRYELFRILDNFNVSAVGEKSMNGANAAPIRSATEWTTCYDTKDRVLYYHTMNNRRVRQVELQEIDFATPGPIQHYPLDKEPAEDIEDVTPKK
jgi:choloylglycine hydrolase